MRKRTLSVLLILAMIATMVPAAIAAEYTDVDSHWAHSAITRWSGSGVVQGSDGQFHPDANMTVAELATVLNNTMGYTTKAANTFADLKGDEWYADAVLKLTGAGILKGDGTNINAEMPVDRERAAVIMARTLNIRPVAAPDLSEFTDGAAASDWAAGYIAAMSEAGIMQGTGGGALSLDSNMNRASVLTILDKSVSDYITTGGTHAVSGDGIVIVKAGTDVTLTGTAKDIIVAPGSAKGSVTLDKATVTGTVSMDAADAKLVAKDAKLTDITVDASGAAVELQGSSSSKSVVVEETASNAKLTVSKGATVSSVETAGSGVAISGGGTVGSLTVTGGKEVTVSKDTTVSKVDNQSENNVTVGDKVVKPDESTEDKPATGGGSGSSYSTYTAAKAEELTAALDKAGTGDTIKITADIGGVAAFGTYTVKTGVKIIGENSAKVYGSFAVTAENVSFANLDIYNKYTADNAAQNKNAITAYADSLTVTGCTFNGDADAAAYEPNGIVIFPKTAGGAYCVTGNTFRNYDNVTADKMYCSAGVFVAEQYPMSQKPFLTTEGAVSVAVSAILTTKPDAAIALANTYDACAYGYIRQDGFDWSKADVNQTTRYALVCNHDALDNAAAYTRAGTEAEIVLGSTFADASFTSQALQDLVQGKTVTMNLNSHKVTVTGSKEVALANGTNLTIQNGKLDANNNTSIYACFLVKKGCSITLDQVEVSSTGSVLFPDGNAASVTVKDSKITTTGVYVIGTNATGPDNYGVAIEIDNSTLEVQTTDSDACAVMINVAGTLAAKDATIIGQRQAVIVRAGEATFENCTIHATPKELSAGEHGFAADPTKWGDGNRVAYGAVIVGNNTSTTYNANANATLTNCTISCTTPESGDLANPLFCAAIYAARVNNATYTTAVTVAGGAITDSVVQYGTAVITGYTGTITPLPVAP